MNLKFTEFDGIPKKYKIEDRVGPLLIYLGYLDFDSKEHCYRFHISYRVLSLDENSLNQIWDKIQELKK